MSIEKIISKLNELVWDEMYRVEWNYVLSCFDWQIEAECRTDDRWLIYLCNLYKSLIK